MSTKAKNVVLILLMLLTIAAIGLIVWRMLDDAAKERAHQRLLAEYPTAYTEWINQYASVYELDPYLVTAIMRCESSNDANAVSPKGAIGLMQIMPDTGAWIAHKLEEEPFDEAVLYDPETNIRFACWYIHFLDARLDGDVCSMIAAYNAGHGSVETWLASTEYAMEGKLTKIPFPETERYVKKVSTALENYMSLYPALYDGSALAGHSLPMLYLPESEAED